MRAGGPRTRWPAGVKPHTGGAAAGFTLVEIAIVLGVVAILAALAIPLLAPLNDAARAVKAGDETARVYAAIAGVAGTGSFGYLGDVGRWPASLLDLTRDPGFEGWNGPYLSGIGMVNDVVVDAFGDPLEYFSFIHPNATADSLAIISRGPDHVSTNTSPTPNIAATFTGPLPSSGGYLTATQNKDNVVYPLFTNNLGFLAYNNVGQLNLNVLNYDANPAVSAWVPACPNRFEVKVTSATRPTDTWGTATPGSTPAYAPGGASFDLIQGVYKVQVRLGTSPYGVVWDETLPVSPGATQSRTLHVPGPNSATTPQYTLQVTNNLSFGITIFSGATSIGAAAAGGGSSGPLLVRGCTPLTVRNTATQDVIDAFIMPIGITPFRKIYGTTTFTYTLTNSQQVYRYLFVYLNDLLIGEVSGWGVRKVKAFGGLRTGDTLTIKDQNGNLPVAPIVIAGSGSNTL
jgi:prepilin-type N-terminal cleavage/methylation domain-containing protein